MLQILTDGVQSSLRIQCVEDGLHNQNVGSTVHEANDLLVVRRYKLVECDVSYGGVFYTWRYRPSSIGRTACSDNKAGLRRIFPRNFIASLASQTSRCVVQLIREMLHLVVGLCDRRRAECVCTDQTRSAAKVLQIDILNHCRLCDR